jgi:hypothetical protein
MSGSYVAKQVQNPQREGSEKFKIRVKLKKLSLKRFARYALIRDNVALRHFLNYFLRD